MSFWNFGGEIPAVFNVELYVETLQFQENDMPKNANLIF